MPENNAPESIVSSNQNTITNNSVSETDTPKNEKETKKSIAYSAREGNLKYIIRAICVIDEVYKIIEQALIEEIPEYKIMYVYDEQLYTMGYEKKDKYVFAVWCPDGSVRTFESLDDVKKKVTLGHGVTIIREFLTGADGKVVEVPLESNFMLKPFLVHNNNKDYNLNMSAQISDIMQKLADSKVDKLDENGKKTIRILIIIFIVLLLFIIFVVK